MKTLILPSDANGQRLVALPGSDYIDARILAAGQAVAHAVPATAKYVLISATDDLYVRFGGAAAVPGGTVTDGSASEHNPGLRALDGATTIGLAAPRACAVTLGFWQ